MQANRVYGFQLKVNNLYKYDINALPQNGVCNVVIPNNNIQLFKSFNIKCSNWELNGNQTPLLYYNVVNNNILWSNMFTRNIKYKWQN